MAVVEQHVAAVIFVIAGLCPRQSNTAIRPASVTGNTLIPENNVSAFVEITHPHTYRLAVQWRHLLDVADVGGICCVGIAKTRGWFLHTAGAYKDFNGS